MKLDGKSAQGKASPRRNIKLETYNFMGVPKFPVRRHKNMRLIGSAVQRYFSMVIRIKRAYETPTEDDGYRILVDRLWPRGISKAKAKIDFWPKELAPSTDLRRWYGHDPAKWSEFKSRYFAELDANIELIKELFDYVRRGTVTFIYSSKEQDLNNAVALRGYIESLTP